MTLKLSVVALVNKKEWHVERNGSATSRLAGVARLVTVFAVLLQMLSLPAVRARAHGDAQCDSPVRGEAHVPVLLAALGGGTYACGDGACPDCHKIEDPGESATWTSAAGTFINKVVIKSGAGGATGAEFTFTTNGSDGCYSVSGIGTRTATAARMAEDSPSCQAISHVRFYYDCRSPCAEVTEWSAWVDTSPWIWDAGEQDYAKTQERYKYDRYNETHVCETDHRTIWQDYKPCTVDTEVVRTGGSSWVHKDGQLCRSAHFRQVDGQTGEVCTEFDREECIPYQGCSSTAPGSEIGRTGPTYEGGRECWEVQYARIDSFTGSVCGSEKVTECTQIENGCNSASFSRSDVRQGQPVTMRFSAWGTGVTGIEVYLLSDARDGQRPSGVGGGAWYLMASAGPEGGSVTIDSGWLFPKKRLVLVRAFYRGVYSDCHSEFRVSEGPTRTYPVAGLEPCPSCVKDPVYQTSRAGQWDICKAREDGTQEVRLTDHPAADKAPHWHPSGQYITFQSDRDANWEVYTMDANGASQLNVSQNPAADVAPFWSCRYIYFQTNRDGNWEIYRMSPDGTQQMRMTNSPAADAEPSSSCYERVAFQSNRDGNWEIYSMNSDGTDVRRLTNTPWDEAMPEWSPNGEWIVFQTDKNGQREIAVMDKDGANLRYIVRSAAPDQAAAWYPYCDWIYFQTFRAGSWDIYRTNQDGTVTQRVTSRASSAEMLDDGNY